MGRNKPDDDCGTHEDAESLENDAADTVVVDDAHGNELDETADAEKQLNDARPNKTEIQPSATPVSEEEAVKERRPLRLAMVVALQVGPFLCAHTLCLVAQTMSAFIVLCACCSKVTFLVQCPFVLRVKEKDKEQTGAATRKTLLGFLRRLHKRF